MMFTAREWMYKLDTLEYYEGIEEFAKQACRHAKSECIRCPCKKCKHKQWKDLELAKFDLYRFGFTPNYYVWINHGEKFSQNPAQQVPNVEPLDTGLRYVFQVLALKASSRLYTGGSVSIPEHKRRLREKLKREPTAAELFLRTYTQRSNMFDDNVTNQPLRKKLSREPITEPVHPTHKRKRDTFVDNAPKETKEQDDDNHSDASVGSNNGIGVDHVGSKDWIGGDKSAIVVDYDGSKNEIEVDHVGSKNEMEVDHAGSKNGEGVDHTGSKNVNRKGVDHAVSKNAVAADQVGTKSGIGVDHVGSNDKLGVEHIGSKIVIGADKVVTKNGIGVDQVGPKNEIVVDHVGSKNEIEVDHVGSKNEMEVAHVGSKNEMEVDQAGSKNGIEVDHVGLKNEIEVDRFGSKNEMEVDHAGSKNRVVVNEDTSEHNAINEPLICTPNNQELVHLREMLEHQLAEQQVLRAEQDRLRATQLAQSQKLDQIMQFQSSMEETLRRIVTQEMEKATKMFLDVLQHASPTS